MSNPAKRKGTAWESLLVATLSGFFRGRYGLAPRRVAQQGHDDLGDIHGVSPFVGQAKAYADITTALREGLAGAVVQAGRAGECYGVAFVKRPRGSAGEGYAVLRVEDWARVLLRLRRAESLVRDFGGHEPVELLADAAEADLAEPFPRA